MYCRWLYLLICIVVDQPSWCQYCRQAMLFCTNALCYISTTSSYHKLRLNIQLEGVDSDGSSWWSRSIRTDCNGMIRAVWWEERLWMEGLQATWVRLLQRCSWLQQPDHLRYITMQILIVLSFLLLICFISLFDGVVESHCCLCKCYNAYVSSETPIFYCN